MTVSPAEPLFAADAMLGRLARWLRVLGYDTTCDAQLADPDLVRAADAEGRVLLTRDRHLLRELRPAHSLELRQDEPLAQLRHVVQELGLAGPRRLFTRCLLCNCVLQEVPAAEARPLLPPGVQALDGPVRRCPACRRLYWNGSHVRRMRAALQRGLPEIALAPQD